MSKWIDKLPTAAQTYLQNRRLDEVECIISDLPGVARGKAVPASKFARQTSFHLPDSIFYQTITGDWGEAAGDEGFIERDMVLRPDMATASAAPWTADWTLQVIHDAYDRNGVAIPYSPRNVLKRVVKLYHDRGWKPVVAPEMEFFLVARNLDPTQNIKPMIGRSGRPAAARQSLGAFVFLCSRLYHACGDAAIVLFIRRVDSAWNICRKVLPGSVVRRQSVPPWALLQRAGPRHGCVSEALHNYVPERHQCTNY